MTRWPSRTAFLAVFMALLVVSVAPVAAANSALGSLHTTNADFEAGSYSGFTTSSGGLEISNGPGVVDDFEDGGLSEYEGDLGGGWSVQTGTVYEGSYALATPGSTSGVIGSYSGLDHYPEAGDTFSFRAYLPGSSDGDGVRFAVQPDGDFYGIDLTNYYTTEFRLVKTSDSGGFDLLDSTSKDVPTGQWVKVVVDWGTDGKITAKLYDESGSLVSTLSATDTQYTGGGVGYRSADRDGMMYVDAFEIENTPVSSATYTSAPHEVTGATEGFVDVSELSGADLSITWQGSPDGSSWTDVTSTTVTSPGNVSRALSGSYDYWRVKLDATDTSGSPVVRIVEEGILFQNSAPSADDGSADPSGSEISRYEDVTLSAEISDPDFGSIQGETVTAEFFVDGSKVGETTASSAGTVSYTASGLSEGNHTWHVVLSDEYGGSATSSTWSFEVAHEEPSADDGSADPSGSETLHTTDPTLSISVTDPDFPRDGDTVTAEFYVDGTLEATKTISSNGTVSHTPTGLSDGSHTWHVELSDEYGYSSSSGTFSFTVDHDAPEYDASSASPSDGETVTTRTIPFNLSVSDVDFSRQGDAVNASLYVDGSLVGSETLTENGTASVSWTAAEGGSHTYYWTLSDEYGYSTTTETFHFGVPGTLEIRSETNASKLIDDAGSAELIFYGETVNERRETSDGTINMTGLPVNEEFTVVIRIDGYHVRRVLIDSLTEQSSVFVLSENETTVAPIFQYSDLTGSYPKDQTKLYVEKAVVRENSSSAEWQVITGDYIGASGEFPTYLVRDGRYRLVIENSLGDRRVVGTYHPTHDGYVPVEVGKVTFQVTGVDVWQQGNDVVEIEAENGTEKAIRFKFSDPEGRTTGLELTISDENGTVVAQESGSEQLGEYVFSWPIPEDREEETFTVEWSASRDGEEIGGRDRQSAETFGVSLPSTIGSSLQGILAAGIVLLLGGVFGAGNSEIGGIVAAGAAGIFVLAGWLDIGLGVVTLAMAIAVAQKFGSGRAAI